jgi:hypothetical protein
MNSGQRCYPPPPGFSQVFILKEVKVLCFDTLLQVLILKGLTSSLVGVRDSKILKRNKQLTRDTSRGIIPYGYQMSRTFFSSVLGN